MITQLLKEVSHVRIIVLFHLIHCSIQSEVSFTQLLGTFCCFAKCHEWMCTISGESYIFYWLQYFGRVHATCMHKCFYVWGNVKQRYFFGYTCQCIIRYGYPYHSAAIHQLPNISKCFRLC